MPGFYLILLVSLSLLVSQSNALTGIVAAAYTPFNDDLSLNLDAIPAHVDVFKAALLQAQGITQVLLCGTTGESVKLTPSERMSIVEAWAEIASDYNLVLYVHVGDASVQVAQELAAHAAVWKVAGIVAMSTIFFTPSNITALVVTMDAIASTVPSLPFYYYHIPDQTNVDFNMYDFLVEVDRTGLLTNLAGIKASYYDLMDFTMCINYKNRFGNSYDMLIGRDEILLGAIAMGCKGAVGSTYNYMGAIMNEMWTAFNNGNLTRAQEIQNQNIDMVHIIHTYSSKGQDAGKATMNLMGVPVGQPRLPNFEFSDGDYEDLTEQLINLGILNATK